MPFFLLKEYGRTTGSKSKYFYAPDDSGAIERTRFYLSKNAEAYELERIRFFDIPGITVKNSIPFIVRLDRMEEIFKTAARAAM